MRKNRERPYGSPRFKLELKSPGGKQKLKISSPMHSARSSLKPQLNNHRSQQRQDGSRIIWLPNPTLYSIVHPLQRIESINLSFKLTISSKNQNQKIWVISSIDSFIETYMQLNDKMKVQCEKWYIISNAMNSKQMQTDFNQNYSPIKFYFMSNISNVCNQLLNYTNVQQLQDINDIYDLGLACAPQFISIQQCLLQNISNPIENCLYIINDAKQWMLFSTKIKNTHQPYFITGVQQIKNGKINVRKLLQKPIIQNPKVFYVLFAFQRNISQIQGFRQHQKNYFNKINDPTFIKKINEKNPTYLSKLIQKWMIPFKRICIFYQNLSKSSLLNIKDVRQMLNPSYFLLQSTYYKYNDSFYKLKWNSRIKSCQQFSINTAVSITDQIRKIEQYIEQKNNLILQFNKQLQKLKKMQIVLYDKDKPHRHCISSVLQHCGIKINIINDLDLLFETHKITIIYGHFTFAQIKSMNKFYNVFLVPLSKDHQQLAAFNQITQSTLFLQTTIKAYNQLYAQVKSEPVQAFVHALYENQQQLMQLLKSLTIQQSLLKTHYIPNFHISLSDFRQFSKHLIIVSMDLFNEQLQSIIRQTQWKCNTISIEVYLRYGQQFIFRNKEGSYKFIKAVQLQNKINQLQEFCMVEQAKTVTPNPILSEPAIKNLPEIENIDYKQGELDNLVVEQSEVELYVDNLQQNNQAINKIQPEPLNQYYNLNNDPNQKINKINVNQNGGSLIKLLNQSVIKESESVLRLKSQSNPQPYNEIPMINSKKQNIIQLKNKNKLIGDQTLQIIEQTIKNNNANNRISQNSKLLTPRQVQIKEQQCEPSISFNLLADESNRNINKPTINERMVKPIQNNYQLQKKQDRNQSNNKQKKQRQKSTYIKQYKQYNHKPIKTASPNKIQDDLQLNLDLGKQYQTTGPQFYKMYIFIHRSVPHHSLARRHGKEYHILVYTRLEEILMFARYLKPEEKIVVIANEQSSKIYAQLLLQSGINQQRIILVFNKDLSQNFIRKQVDKILLQEKLQEAPKIAGKNGSKKFKALIVYAMNNQRVLKSVKIVRKIFGAQIKLAFLKEKQYQQMKESKFNLKLNNQIKVYKIGLNPKQNQIQITSIRNLFILAMHPDLKPPNLDFSLLQFSLEAYIGRLLYGGSEKNYVMVGKTTKKTGGADTFRRKIQGMKSETNFIKQREKYLSHLKTDNSQRPRSQTPRQSSISCSSTVLLKTYSKVCVISSTSLQQSYNSKIRFFNEDSLYIQIITCHSLSKLPIIVLTQKQFDMFEIFQSRLFYEMTKEIIWIVETKTQGKQIFVGSNIVFSTSQNLSQAVECVIKQYQNHLNFDSLNVNSKVQVIKSGQYGTKSNKQIKSELSKSLNLIVLQNSNQISQETLKLQNSKNMLIIYLNKESKKSKAVKNCIYFPSMQCMTIFVQALSGRFEGGPQIQSYQSFGSQLLVPQKHIQKISKSIQTSGKKNIVFRTYDPENLSTLIAYSIFRALIVIDKQNGCGQLEDCPYTIAFQKNMDKMGKLLTSNLL